MKIIISPAKKMNIETDTLPVTGMPGFIEDTKILQNHMQQLSYIEAKKLWKCNDKLAMLNYERIQKMNLEKGLTPAVLTYEGLQYQHMAPKIFTEEAIAYIAEHLRILSGFYGVLMPFDGVVPYRLEMGAKMSVDNKKDLYDFWGEKLYQAVLDEDHLIINLASKEYSQAVAKYLSEKDRFITIEFGEYVDGKVKQKGTFAKMARGEMVRFMAENQMKNVEDIKDFRVMGMKYCDELSSETSFIFIK